MLQGSCSGASMNSSGTLSSRVMATVPMDAGKVARCRALAGDIADDVQRFIDAHTTVGVERTVLRAYGVDGADDQGAPLVNTASSATARPASSGAASLSCSAARCSPAPRPAGGRRARSPTAPELDRRRRAVPAAPRRAPRSRRHTDAALARIDGARDEREALQGAPRAPGRRRCKYVIVATGNIYDDADPGARPPRTPAPTSSPSSARPRSRSSTTCPHGATTEGYGGTFATQENFQHHPPRRSTRASERARPLPPCRRTTRRACAWPRSPGWRAVERLDMLLNDAMYGILFRDINMCRTFVDQYFSRRIIARAGIVINTGEDNYLTTADAVEKAHTVLASQFINEAFAKRAGLPEEQMGLGHAFEIDPWIED